MTSTVAMMCTTSDAMKGEEEAPVMLKLGWGVVMGLIAWIVITFAKIDGLRAIVSLAAAPPPSSSCSSDSLIQGCSKTTRA